MRSPATVLKHFACFFLVGCGPLPPTKAADCTTSFCPLGEVCSRATGLCEQTVVTNPTGGGSAGGTSTTVPTAVTGWTITVDVSPLDRLAPGCFRSNVVPPPRGRTTISEEFVLGETTGSERFIVFGPSSQLLPRLGDAPRPQVIQRIAAVGQVTAGTTSFSVAAQTLELGPRELSRTAVERRTTEFTLSFGQTSGSLQLQSTYVCQDRGSQASERCPTSLGLGEDARSCSVSLPVTVRKNASLPQWLSTTSTGKKVLLFTRDDFVSDASCYASRLLPSSNQYQTASLRSFTLGTLEPTATGELLRLPSTRYQLGGSPAFTLETLKASGSTRRFLHTETRMSLGPVERNIAAQETRTAHVDIDLNAGIRSMRSTYQCQDIGTQRCPSDTVAPANDAANCSVNSPVQAFVLP